MNVDASGRKRRPIRAAVAVSMCIFMSAVFGAATAQDDDGGYGEAGDFGASAQSEASGETAAAQDGDASSGEEISDGGVQTAAEEETAERGGKGGKSGVIDNTPMFTAPKFELGLGMATVDGKRWMRADLGAEFAIWKFGFFLDFELFLDDKWKLSNKSWDFKNNPAEAVLRKIRYVRYGQENEPLFVKFGGLENVTLGYGMIVDGFTNMLRFPDEKLLGLQFYMNDVSPIGLTVQTLISDFAEAGDGGGLYAARLAVRPLKTSELFLLDGLSVGGMYAADANVLAPARTWSVSGDDAELRDNREKYKVSDPAYFESLKSDYEKKHGLSADDVLTRLDAEDSLSKKERSFALYGFDITLPVVSTDILEVDIYGQSAFRADAVSGWSVGVPGAAARLWKILYGQVEYRYIEGRFMPEYFDTYYLDERYSRNLMKSKDESLSDVSLNGVFGRVGADIFGAIDLSGTYQHMFGKNKSDNTSMTSRYCEAKAGVGKTVLEFIPKLNLAEAYMRNAGIGSSYHDKNGDVKTSGFFDPSPGMYFGYRAGIEIAAGLTLIWDYRYGWKEENDKLVSDDQWSLRAAVRF